MRWVGARADKRGYVRVDGREYVAGPHWHGRELLVGVRPATVEVQAEVNRVLAGGSAGGSEPSVDELARAVIAGRYGVGEARRQALGSRYAEVQRRVNELLS